MVEISQSLIKDFFFKGEKRDYCPAKIKAGQITSESQNKGNYFETLCLGEGRDGEKTDDLPRKKLTAKQILEGRTIGEKTIDHKRIDEQHLVFEKYKTIYQINVQKEVNTQVRIYKEYSKNDGIVLRGDMDIFPTTILLPERGLRLSIIDLKLTAKFGDWGEYCWATPASMDHTQGFMYHYLGRDIDIDFNMAINPESKLQYLYTGSIKKQLEQNELLFFYWVFTYKESNPVNKFVEVPWNQANKAELMESIRKTIEEYNKCERNGWKEVKPSPYNCNNCALLNCSSRYVSEQSITDNNQFESV